MPIDPRPVIEIADHFLVHERRQLNIDLSCGLAGSYQHRVEARLREIDKELAIRANNVRAAEERHAKFAMEAQPEAFRRMFDESIDRLNAAIDRAVELGLASPRTAAIQGRQVRKPDRRARVRRVDDKRRAALRRR